MTTKRRATPQQAGALLGSIALGTTTAVTSSLAQGLVAGIAAGAAAFAITRWQSGRSDRPS